MCCNVRRHPEAEPSCGSWVSWSAPCNRAPCSSKDKLQLVVLTDSDPVAEDKLVENKGMLHLGREQSLSIEFEPRYYFVM